MGSGDFNTVTYDMINPSITTRGSIHAADECRHTRGQPHG